MYKRVHSKKSGKPLHSKKSETTWEWKPLEKECQFHEKRMESCYYHSKICCPAFNSFSSENHSEKNDFYSKKCEFHSKKHEFHSTREKVSSTRKRIKRRTTLYRLFLEEIATLISSGFTLFYVVWLVSLFLIGFPLFLSDFPFFFEWITIHSKMSGSVHSIRPTFREWGRPTGPTVLQLCVNDRRPYAEKRVFVTVWPILSVRNPHPTPPPAW